MAHLTPFLLSCFIFVTLVSSNDVDPDWMSFSDPEENDTPLLLIQVHNVTGDVYVAKPNALYHLDADLMLKEKVPLWPQQVCEAPGVTCDGNMTTKTYFPRSLTIVYHLESPMLMICNSLYNGMCELRFLSNLAHSIWIGPYDDNVALCNKKLYDPAFFGPGFGNQLVFYSGADSYPEKDAKDDSLPFFSSKVLLYENGQYRFKYSYRTNESMSAIFFRGESKQVLLYSFIYKSHVFFVFLRIAHAQKFTIIARVCVEDGSFHSYIEQPLICIADGKNFRFASAAFLGPTPKHLLHKFSKTSKRLYIAFTENAGSVICGFQMFALNHFFESAIKNCFTVGNETNVMNPYNMNLTPCTKTPNVDSRDYCGSNVNPYITSRRRITSNSVLSFNIPTFQITALAVFEQNTETLMFVGSNKGLFTKVLVMKDHQVSLHMAIAKGDGIKSAVAFDLMQKHLYFISKNKIFKYPIDSCLVSKTCSECFKSKKDTLACGWCDGRCSQIHECVNPESFKPGKCSPFIQTVEPVIAPTQRETNLTIIGTNFGKLISRKNNYVTVAGVECRIRSWDNDKIVCGLSPTPISTSGHVQLTTKDGSNKALPFEYEGFAESKELFSFVTPKLLGISPGRGSIHGNTNVTIFGEHLDIGKEYLMNIRGRICTSLRIQKETATCYTGTSFSSNLKDTIEMKIDEIYIGIDTDARLTSPLAANTSEDFKYLSDPEIYTIHPTMTIINYRGNVTVTGRYLDSALEHRMMVNILSSATEKVEYEQPCWLNIESGGTTMVCSMPALESIDFTFPKDGPLPAQVAFLLDGSRKEFPNLSHLEFYPEPEYKSFQEIQEITRNVTFFEIKGKYSGTENEAELINVKIGESVLCKISALTVDTLHCVLPQELLTNASVWGKHLSVEVSAGSSQHHLGYLMIMDRDTEPVVGKKLWTVVLASVLIVIICLFAIIGGWCFYKRRKPDKLHHLTACTGATTVMNDYPPVPLPQQAKNATSVPVPEEAKVTLPLPRKFSREPSMSTTTSLAESQVPLLEKPKLPPQAFSRGPSTGAIQSRVLSETSSISAVDDPATTSTNGLSHQGYLDMNKPQNGTTSNQPRESLIDSPHRQMIQRTISDLGVTFEETVSLLTRDGLLIHTEQLSLGSVVGAGQFGSVYKAEYSCPKKGNIEVAVKTLHSDAPITEQVVMEFLNEGVKMKDFHHKHVIELIGICFENRLPMVVTHYMSNGDLCGYLNNADNVLFVTDLLKFTAHIAAGMAYLATARFVHRDLAARNCVLDSDLKVKVADFGLSRDIYEKDYYTAENKRKLPLRWMAPESMELGKYTEKTDVWSYGIVVWEIMTRGVTPYGNNFDKWWFLEYIKTGMRLSRPQYCSKEMYQVLLSCWDLDPLKRPNFKELHENVKSLLEFAPYTDRIQSVPAHNLEYADSDED